MKKKQEEKVINSPKQSSCADKEIHITEVINNNIVPFLARKISFAVNEENVDHIELVCTVKGKTKAQTRISQSGLVKNGKMIVGSILTENQAVHLGFDNARICRMMQYSP